MAKSLQKYTLDTSVIPRTNQEQLGKLLIFRDKNARYRKNYIAWDNIERANPSKNLTKKTKYLSKPAENIVALVVQKLEKGERVILNHKYLSSITKCERRQNQRILQQLSEILDITYHNSVTHEGKKYRYSYEFCHKLQKLDNTTFSEESVGTFLTRQNEPLYIDKNKDIEYIDLQSNFLKISKEKEKQKEPAKIFYLDKHKSSKKLSDFYPMNQEDCATLQTLSGREFSLNAMNEILLDMSNRRTNVSFYSKKGFIAYMSKAFANEMRQAPIANNLYFKIKNNLTINNINLREQEKFLAEIESSLQVSKEWHLKKKLACVLSSDTAYRLLKSYKSIEVIKSVFKIHLYRPVSLTVIEKEIIFNQVKATHESFNLNEISECRLDFIVSKKTNEQTNEQKEWIPEIKTETYEKPEFNPMGSFINKLVSSTCKMGQDFQLGVETPDKYSLAEPVLDMPNPEVFNNQKSGK